ncbi:MAG TPA: hypothetical protein VKS79_23230 [Gemmataceae bacterium]|nr:hypothetical protein [Gemmataceae bacterium]
MFSWIQRLLATTGPPSRQENLLQSLACLIRLHQEAYVLQLRNDERYRDPRRLLAWEHQVYSQGGEDGIIAEIFRRIGTKNRTFVEIGVGDGLENNTAFLLTQGWSGFWLEGDPECVRKIRVGCKRAQVDRSLHLIELFVTGENVASALQQAGAPTEVDLLSIDVDQNTYWIWSALGQISARVVVVEYNAAWPAAVDWKVPYDPAEMFDGTLCFGASLKALELLGRQFGYNLVGCNLAGVNAFFVRSDLCGDHFAAPFSAENHYEPPRYWLIRPRDGRGTNAPILEFPRSYGPLQMPRPASGS